MGKLEDLYQKKEKNIPSLPSRALKIIQTFLTKTDNDFLELLETEKELESFILQVVNLPRFRKDALPVTNFRMALLILGDKHVKILGLGYLTKLLFHSIDYGFQSRLFWARALTNLVASSFFSDLITPYPEHLHLVSLLMDYGMLLLFMADPEAYLEVLKKHELDKPLFEAEEEIFGVDHAEICAEYFEQFPLPRRFILNLRYHHTEPPTPFPLEILRDLRLLRMIDYGVGSFFTYRREERMIRFKEIAQEFLTETEIGAFFEVFPAVANNYLEIFDYPEFKLLSQSEYEKEKEELLQKEAERLEKEKEIDPKELLKKYEELKISFLKEKEKLLSAYYQALNLLKQERIYDEATGLLSFIYFQNRVKEELLRSRRYAYPFSLLLIDLDLPSHFLEKLGYDTSYNFFQELAKVLQKNLRRTDLISYGGNTSFYILLPHTPATGAMVVARKLFRKVTEYLKKNIDQTATIYISVLNYNPRLINPKQDISEILLFSLLKRAISEIKKSQTTKIFLVTVERDI